MPATQRRRSSAALEPLEDDDACRRERRDLVEECAALPGVGSVRHVERDGLVVEPDLVVSVAGLQLLNKMGVLTLLNSMSFNFSIYQNKTKTPVMKKTLTFAG